MNDLCPDWGRREINESENRFAMNELNIRINAASRESEPESSILHQMGLTIIFQQLIPNA